MSQTPPRLADRAALDRNRARVRPEALFLHEIAAEQFEDRLGMVKRSFTKVAIVTGHVSFWKSRFPAATVLADTPTLALAPDTFDLVLHAMALHWADDPVGQLVQCRRALVPDGLCLAVSLGGQTLSELRVALAETETRLSGGLSPRVAPMLELRDAGSLLQRAGFALPVADAERLTVTYRDALALMRELRAMGESNALARRDARPGRSELFTEATAFYAEHFAAEDNPGRIRATFELIHLSGWAPAADQPQPLRPGSAQIRLADALGTSEHPLRDDKAPGRD